ncbi:hypothetical protein DN068_07255 [Taibaiella soli]|uniref:Integral membrane bound transporter domain-containing protein n=2 Tax=Taibaiella soli TaxID=1649169 RepID=A0A2W2ADJ7_9BACT|nr:hypothetical protein DN068_07255 [Taibaiella soli]
MAVASVAPVIWGVATGHMDIAEWITLTAEGICWVELRGGAGLRMRVLVGGTLLTFFFALLGSITGTSIWLSMVCMLFVGFLSSLFKNLGDRGSGLAICAYVMFIICNAYPVKTLHSLEMRSLYILIGGVWTILVGLAASAFVPEQEPYRRSIAMILKSIASLIDTVSKGWDGNGVRSGLREIYTKEKDVRASIDSSIHFFESMAYQVTHDKGKEYNLAHTRKATSLIAAHVIAISEELDSIKLPAITNATRLKLYALHKALQQTVERLAEYVLSLKPEEELLLNSRIERLRKIIKLLNDHLFEEDASNRTTIFRVIQLTERSIKLVESCVNNMKQLGEEQPIYRSYSLIKTLYILHPKHLLHNIRILFDMNTNTARYALRTALAATLAMFIFKWFNIDHGYWLPFTVIIIIQPYFGATFTKAIDRTLGTVLGGIAGGLLLRLPTALHVKEIFMFICAVLMVYYLRKKYSVAAFFITVSLVLLFAVESELSWTILFSRLFCTITGALLGIVAGFALLPTWDKKYLPRYLAESIYHNYEYFKVTFFPDEQQTALPWTKYKRLAETGNSNAFDSFNRFLQEPSGRKKSFSLFFQLITYNVRLTRELNSIHLEIENNTAGNTAKEPDAEQQALINECLYWFNKSVIMLQKINPAQETTMLAVGEILHSPFVLTQHQYNYLNKMLIDLKSMHQDLQELILTVDTIMESSTVPA